MTDHPISSRREFLTGHAARRQVEHAGDVLADEILHREPGEKAITPTSGDTVRLATTAMNCEFCVVLNPDNGEQIDPASNALEQVHELENQLSLFRAGSEISLLNRRAYSEAVYVESELFHLLRKAEEIARNTNGCFDPTAGQLVQLWRACRKLDRIPVRDEIASCLNSVGMKQIHFDVANKTVRFLNAEAQLDLGGIGKGYALDKIGDWLEDAGISEFLLSSGFSSLKASGEHNHTGGWPVGLRNPLFPDKDYATIVLENRSLSSSGASIKRFRHNGKNYGHILDPRTGSPADKLLSVTVVAPTATEADALSTAFFVGGVEIACNYCHNRNDDDIGAILTQMPLHGRTLEPIVLNIPPDSLFFHEEFAVPRFLSNLE